MPINPATDRPTAATRADVVRWIERDRAVAVVRTDEPEKLVQIAQALQVGGVVCFEVTMTVPNAIEGIRAVTEAMSGSVLVGAGSVTDAETARAAIEAGARYVVSPVFRREVIEAAHDLDAAAMPGCFTPTEIYEATEAGADVAKVFPAGALGPGFIRGVLAPLPHLKLMPTGGVSLDNASEWLRAGAVAVGAGSALVETDAVAAGDWARLTANAKRLRASVDAA
ncbi:bifunctional 4-hydroxy-2-oxoglutarate aldolase/2-dehydro-3-deoxy-phosphogluconate aldolase [Rubrivirga sp. S365]|uniref:Bifunctional 4-hydroxy-2-oxoglutarate aldolase/2-dehydro-3-deoxy-phosphogluconate aldolase n=1 Tax=Rubrivirga litoralis TaxID=3075598 RepID=A0ABU3BNM0_9BACT|nr:MULTISPECIES: bifunctional 4-hydroxy-2-oxoglutarate aldolase/2-dehydro-3-deoxy-phosphogluconate aldolase [unclassified Rubrivirga]MDT0630899.1 bifunctional 4-hydroxy-2-oxoglutarate aldolase/2-dehydro-3-deoxy-phosphogluconate aldolase [Rubrivirga sp. F394]MDT7856542.1 bifunctional 4-hydroxy-2-oxoglutarate aldolase/2-dehydro-3-deoxy-phosphogluconate aldolase [Rubrivirga sp. S365]